MGSIPCDFLRCSVDSKRGVGCRDSTRIASRIQRKEGADCLNRLPRPTLLLRDEAVNDIFNDN